MPGLVNVAGNFSDFAYAFDVEIAPCSKLSLLATAAGATPRRRHWRARQDFTALIAAGNRLATQQVEQRKSALLNPAGRRNHFPVELPVGQ
jgi:hypothetical protein